MHMHMSDCTHAYVYRDRAPPRARVGRRVGGDMRQRARERERDLEGDISI